jgi:hypothetical protein
MEAFELLTSNKLTRDATEELEALLEDVRRVVSDY